MDIAVDNQAVRSLNEEVRGQLARLRSMSEHPELHAALTRWLEPRLSAWCEFALLCSRVAGEAPRQDLVSVVSAWLMICWAAGPLDDDVAGGRNADRAWTELGPKMGPLMRGLVAEAEGLLLGDPLRPSQMAAARVLSRRLQEAALGQAVDLDEVQTLEAYEDVLERQAAILTAALAESVAVLSGAESGRKQALATAGQELGTALLVMKDYRDMWGAAAATEPQVTDLDRPQMTYPVFYALTRPHAYQDEFRALLSQAPAERNTARMREILTAIGAPQFMRDAVQQRTKRALQAVRKISPEGVTDLERWCGRHVATEELKGAH